MLVIAVGFMLAGAWLVMPFMGLELIAVAGVFGWFRRHADDHERIVIEEDRLLITRQRGGRQTHYAFQRYWVRVRIEKSGHPWYPSRLLIGSHGRFVEIAAFVTEDARIQLAGKLKNLLAL